MAGWPATLTACVALCALLAGAHGASESLVADPTAAQASQAQWGAASAKLGEAVGRVLAQEEFDTLVYLEVDPDQFGRDKPQQIDDDDEPLGVRRGVARLGSTGGGGYKHQGRFCDLAEPGTYFRVAAPFGHEILASICGLIANAIHLSEIKALRYVAWRRKAARFFCTCWLDSPEQRRLAARLTARYLSSLRTNNSSELVCSGGRRATASAPTPN